MKSPALVLFGLVTVAAACSGGGNGEELSEATSSAVPSAAGSAETSTQPLTVPATEESTPRPTVRLDSDLPGVKAVTSSMGSFSVRNVSGSYAQTPEGRLFSFVAELVNDSGLKMELFDVPADGLHSAEVIAYDTAGREVDSVSISVCPRILDVGGDGLVQGILDAEPELATYEIRINARGTDLPAPSLAFNITAATLSSRFSTYTLEGSVTNESTHPFDSLGACCAFYDSTGIIVGTVASGVQPSTLHPGESGTFMCVSGPPIDAEVSNHRVWIFGTSR